MRRILAGVGVVAMVLGSFIGVADAKPAKVYRAGELCAKASIGETIRSKGGPIRCEVVKGRAQWMHAAATTAAKTQSCSALIASMQKTSKTRTAAQSAALPGEIAKSCASTGAITKALKAAEPHASSSLIGQVVGELKAVVCETAPAAKLCT